ncbi:hypothetical protein GPECTOR_4g851 [Gonium pectorale]|uniref:Uncharacterized protein n=1 Tax=Gonium pectorale TaxID=33097 RepID=A0A150GY75_GONPE|nr:hypothetical protein GPECTOR_4g851 [Gonium pectorale]|eukprot:KXZ54781.1 hypothetical protein GPECTOR_4g851 [Gonium pectorale]
MASDEGLTIEQESAIQHALNLQIQATYKLQSGDSALNTLLNTLRFHMYELQKALEDGPTPASTSVVKTLAEAEAPALRAVEQHIAAQEPQLDTVAMQAFESLLGAFRAQGEVVSQL